MVEILITTLFGLLGGLLRTLVGIAKKKRIHKKEKLHPIHLIVTILIAGLIGALTPLALETNNFITFVVGYMGIDLLENIVKIIKKRL
ncbi:hypothetical protein J4216_04265 [Candidatus Woesearchaeota archaeon]|nr:hypothetical protein [Candidatus Woesearchaeota archaeon]